MAKVTKKNIVKSKGCKRVKGGRAGCWIRERGKVVFRFTDPSKLSGLGITTVGGKKLPGFAGGRKRPGSRKRSGCKKLKNGRKACWTSKGFRIVG